MVATLKPRLATVQTSRLVEKSGWSNPDRGSADDRGYGARWVKLRAHVLRRDDGLCVPCRRTGRLSYATEVDHIRPKSDGGGDDEANLQAICKSCHRDKTQREGGSGGAMYQPDWLPTPRVPVVVVCGPPGAGKSSYVRERAQPGDVVLDLDEIAAEMTGRPLYHATQDERRAALRVRNARIARMGSDGGADGVGRCWLIVTGTKISQREWWRDKLRAELIELDTAETECMSRIVRDPRRPPEAKERACRGVRAWQRRA